MVMGASGSKGVPKVDNSTLEYSSGAMQVKDGGITTAKLASGLAVVRLVGCTDAGAGLTTGAAAKYYLPGASGSVAAGGTTESVQKRRATFAWTVTEVAVSIITNGAASGTPFALRKNGAATTLTGTIGAGATGVITATGSVAVIAGDQLDIELDVLTGGASLTCDAWHIKGA